MGDLTVVVLDRPRHAELIAEIASRAGRVRLIEDGKVAGGIATAWPGSGADLLLGVGGTAEDVITAAAMGCMAARSRSGWSHETTTSASG